MGKIREQRCIWKVWGKHKAQTVRRHKPEKCYEIREGVNVVRVHNNELDSLIIALLALRSS